MQNAECRMMNVEAGPSPFIILHSAFCILHSGVILSSMNRLSAPRYFYYVT